MFCNGWKGRDILEVLGSVEVCVYVSLEEFELSACGGSGGEWMCVRVRRAQGKKGIRKVKVS